MAFRLDPGKPFTDEFRAVAQRQLTRAIRLLERQPDGPHKAIHEARKRFKRVRALYRLVQSDAKAFRKRENARLRDIANSLSAVRDATALVETVDYLLTQSHSIEEREALSFASGALTERRDRIAAEEHNLAARMKDATDACRAAIGALDELSLDDRPRPTARRLAKAWRKQRSRALTALAECETNAHAEVFHDLRKCGQIYWMHLSLLQAAWPSAMRAKQREAKLLVDLLGHEHDLSVLTGIVNENPLIFGNSATLALVLGAIIVRQQALRKEALERANEVFGDDADIEASRIEMLWRHARREARNTAETDAAQAHGDATAHPAVKEDAAGLA